MTDLKGKTIEYCYQNGDRYCVSFTKLRATWTALSGPAAGSSGTENYKCAMVAPNVFFHNMARGNKRGSEFNS